MRMKRFALMGVLASTGFVLSGCEMDLNKEPPWQVNEIGNNVIYHNGESGEMFVVDDGHLREVDRISLSDLESMKLQTKALPDRSLNLDVTTAYHGETLKLRVEVSPADNRTVGQMLDAEQAKADGEPIPEPEPDYSSVARLIDILEGGDEELSDLSLNFVNKEGISLFTMKLSELDAVRLYGRGGQEVQGLSLSGERRLSAPIYRDISSVDAPWWSKG